MDVPMIKLAERNGKFFVNEREESEFDSVLLKKWKEAEDRGILRYKLKIEKSRVLDGKYRLLLELNRDRGQLRRAPQPIGSMCQPFDASRFNFTRLDPREIILRLHVEDIEDNVVAVNASPLGLGHSLLLTRRLECLPQVATLDSLKIVIKIFRFSHSPDIRVAFNSLCALASVNHLHWHIYYLERRMLLENIELDDFAGPVKTLRDYPARGFCVEYSSVQNDERFAELSFLIINRLQGRNVAHNVYVTRAGLEFEDLRVYIWPRRSYVDEKDFYKFVPAVCEMFGHFVISSEEAFESLTESQASRELREITEETFSSVIEDLRELITSETQRRV